MYQIPLPTVYNTPVRLIRFLLILIYASYLAYAGVIFLLLPWSELWTLAMEKLPASFAIPLGHPAVRGMISAFGILHFLIALGEIRIDKPKKSPQQQETSSKMVGVEESDETRLFRQ